MREIIKFIGWGIVFALLPVVIYAQTDVEKAKAALNYTEWKVKITPPFTFGEQKEPLETDTFKFGRNNVTSKNLENSGFPRSNYSLRIQGNTVIWETMKTRKDGQIIFLRGKVSGDSMGGIINIPAQGDIPAKTFSFSSISKKRLEIPEEERKKIEAEKKLKEEEKKKKEEEIKKKSVKEEKEEKEVKVEKKEEIPSKPEKRQKKPRKKWWKFW